MRRLTLLLGLCGLLVTGVLTASASALGLPPVVTTGTATAPTQTATTLSGTVTPVGLATTYQFDYGTTTSYGMSTTPTSAGSGIAAVPVTANLTGLTPATTYHFRLEATNTSSATPTDGLDGTFTTAGSPVVVTGAATGVTGTTATLGGTVNPSGIAATYVFQYGTTTAYGQQTAAQAAGAGTTVMTASAALTGLAPGTTYHYRLAATNAYTTVPGADATFVTPGAAGASKLSVAVNPAGGNTDLSSTLTIGTDAAGTPGGAATSITQAISSQFANQLASFGTCATSAFENVGGPTSAACTDRSSILGTGTIVTHPQTGTDVASDQGFIVKTAANTVVFWWHTPALGATPASFGAAPGTVSQTTGTYGPIVTYDFSGLPAGTRLKSLTLDYQASAVNGKAPFAASTCVGGSWAFETGILYAGGVTPELPTATVPCGVAAPPQPAKLQVSRATISKSARTIDILAPITHRATGSVKLDLFAAGQHYDWTAAIDSADGRIRTTHSIPVAQADKGTGILTITYAGNAATRPQVVRLRAADVPANLDASRPTYAAGVLHDQGTISSLARGIVRVQLQYFSGGTTTTLEFHAPISNGTWSLNTTLTAAQQTAIAARSGTLHSYILFTGYLPQRMRGEMNSYQVLGAP